MEIQKVQNTPTFTGYVGKSVRRYVNNAVTNEINDIVRLANNDRKAVDKNELIGIRNLGCDVLAKLKRYMAGTHDDTYLDLQGKSVGWLSFVFKNPVTYEDIPEHWVTNSKYPLYLPLRGSSVELASIDKFADLLLKDTDPHSIDKHLLSSFGDEINNFARKTSGFIGRWFLNRKVQKARKFAQQIKEPVDQIITNLDQTISEVNAVRKLTKENNSIKTKVLEG